MNFRAMFKSLEKATVDNSPAILTAIGITGTVATAYLTAKSTLKAHALIREEIARVNHGIHPDRQVDPTRKDVFLMTWRFFIPPTITGVITIASIFGANHVSTRRAAAMATAYSISERAFSEYKEKVVEKIGEAKEQKYRDEIAQERVDRNPVDEKSVIITGNGEVLCLDQFTGRYFMSSMEAIRRAENELNHSILHDGYASLTDLYDLLGLERTAFSDGVGWTDGHLLEIKVSTTMSIDHRPCLAIDFDLRPSRDFQYFAK